MTTAPKMKHETNMTEMSERDMDEAPARRLEAIHRKASPAHAAAKGAYLDSPLKTMLGLIVLWGCLMLIFKAHRLSDSEIRLTGNLPAIHAAGAKSPGPLLDSCVVALPQDFSPREALERVAASFSLDVGKEGLRKLAQTPKAFDIKGVPLYKALHMLIDDHGVGYALEGKSIRLFDQKLESQKNLLNWQAELPLAETPLAIFPSGDFDLWFSIHLIRDNANLQDPWRTLQVELWRGGVHCNTCTQSLDANGKATISISSPRENISLQIERKAPSKGKEAPGRYHMMFTYQVFK